MLRATANFEPRRTIRLDTHESAIRNSISLLSPKSKLIARAHRLATSEINLHDLLAVYRSASLVRQRGDDPLARPIDDFASRWARMFAVEAERDPAWLFAELDTLDLSRRRHCVVEDVDHFVV